MKSLESIVINAQKHMQKIDFQTECFQGVL